MHMCMCVTGWFSGGVSRPGEKSNLGVHSSKQLRLHGVWQKVQPGLCQEWESKQVHTYRNTLTECRLHKIRTHFLCFSEIQCCCDPSQSSGDCGGTPCGAEHRSHLGSVGFAHMLPFLLNCIETNNTFKRSQTGFLHNFSAASLSTAKMERGTLALLLQRKMMQTY